MRERVDVVNHINNLSAVEAHNKNTSTEDSTSDALLKVMFLKKLIYRFWPASVPGSTERSRSIRGKFEEYKQGFLSTSWEVGRSYEVPDNIKYLCETKLKEKISKTFVYLIEDDLNFVLGEKDPIKPNVYKILIKERIYQVDFSVTDKTLQSVNLQKKTAISLKFERTMQANSVLHIMRNNADNKKQELAAELRKILTRLQCELPSQFDMQAIRQSAHQPQYL